MADTCELCGGPVTSEADRVTYYDFAANRERHLWFCEQCRDERFSAVLDIVREGVGVPND